MLLQISFTQNTVEIKISQEHLVADPFIHNFISQQLVGAISVEVLCKILEKKQKLYILLFMSLFSLVPFNLLKLVRANCDYIYLLFMQLICL